MTNEQAIAHFKEQLEVFGGEHHEAMKVAIEALEKQNSCKDCAGCTQWLCECANVRAEVCDRIVEQLEEKKTKFSFPKHCKSIGVCPPEKTCSECIVEKFVEDIIAIVKGEQNE